MKKLSALIFASTLLFSSCNIAPKIPLLQQFRPPTEVEKVLKGNKTITITDDGYILGYDFDNDGNLDYTAYYRLTSKTDNGKNYGWILWDILQETNLIVNQNFILLNNK